MASTARPSAPRIEHRERASVILAVGTPRPRISWTTTAARSGFEQVAYEVEITRGESITLTVVESAEQTLVPWVGEDLRSRERATVRLRVAGPTGWGPWGPATTLEAGLLDPADWSARFISPVSIGRLDEPAPILTGLLHVPGRVREARLYATAHGIYQARINGAPVDDSVLAPGWTSYGHRLRYHAYDVTRLVRSGVNELSALLGNGWYRGHLGWLGDRALYGDRLALCAQLEVRTDDGTLHVLATDGSWTARNSGILMDDLYDGQTTDLRVDTFQGQLSQVEVLSATGADLVAPTGPHIRPLGVLPAQRVWASPTGKTLVDFGQNAVGWVRLTVRGLANGSEVVVRHAEVLEHEELGTRPLRAAKATDTYVVSGRREEVLEPSLTLHGFRYAEVTGIEDLRPEDVEFVLVGTDLERTGSFVSSAPMVNQLHENVVWSTRANFVDVPTDCPQRDERLGWTGDIQVFGPTGLFLFDIAGLLTSWLADLAAEQYPTGGVPHVIPTTNRAGIQDPEACAWGDAATVVPWTIYQRTGDLDILRRQMPSMRAWVDRVTELAGSDRVWSGGFQFGDWLDPTAPPESPAAAKAHPDVVATAHFARSAEVVAKAAKALGDATVAKRYGDMAAEVKAAFVGRYVQEGGRIFSDSQTVYAMALEWDLLPSEDLRQAAAARLAELVEDSGFRIATGFVGTPLICDALTNSGYADHAYRLLLQTECPSWLYPVKMGATSIWERWDSMLPDGTINPGEMTSFNHYALGAVADWLHRTVAGLAPRAPGYRKVTIKPVPHGSLTHASARHDSPFGPIEAGWRREDGQLHVHASIPPGVTAHVYLPGSARKVTVAHGAHTWVVADPVPQSISVGVGA